MIMMFPITQMIWIGHLHFPHQASDVVSGTCPIISAAAQRCAGMQFGPVVGYLGEIKSGVAATCLVQLPHRGQCIAPIVAILTRRMIRIAGNGIAMGRLATPGDSCVVQVASDRRCAFEAGLEHACCLGAGGQQQEDAQCPRTKDYAVMRELSREGVGTVSGRRSHRPRSGKHGMPQPRQAACRLQGTPTIR